MAINIELNEYSAEDFKLINELKKFGLSEDVIQAAYDETQRRRAVQEDDCESDN